MTDVVLFTIRLTADDWDGSTRAWRCPAVDIPTAFIKEALDAKGKPLAVDLFEIKKGPARIRWREGAPPSQVVLTIELAEELSPASEEQRWRKIAIIAPIVSAVGAAAIGAFGTYISRPTPPPVVDRVLQLRVDPNDIEASGLPPARITINGEEPKQPVSYPVKSDVSAIVDVSKAITLAHNYIIGYDSQKAVISRSISAFTSVFQDVDALAAHVGGGICSGGSSGVPSPVAGGLIAQTLAVNSKLKAISSDLQGALSNPGLPTK